MFSSRRSWNSLTHLYHFSLHRWRQGVCFQIKSCSFNWNTENAVYCQFNGTATSFMVQLGGRRQFLEWDEFGNHFCSRYESCMRMPTNLVYQFLFRRFKCSGKRRKLIAKRHCHFPEGLTSATLLCEHENLHISFQFRVLCTRLICCYNAV
jgi:hypothetical protein